MKRIVGIALLVVLSAAACGNTSNSSGNAQSGDGSSGDDWCEIAAMIEAADPSLDLATSPSAVEAQAAADAIGEYNELECDLEPDPDPVDEPLKVPVEDPIDDAQIPMDDAQVPSELLVQGFIEAGFTQAEAECLASRVTLDELATQQPSELFGIFEECGIGIERLAEL